MIKDKIKPAIFLDRDGVINYNRDDYVKSWAEFDFLPGALTALERLAALPLPIVVITNQSAVGRGILNIETLEAIHTRMKAIIHACGGRIDRIVYCPHHPHAGCECRKPKPGLLKQAATSLHLDLSRSFLVGDALTDIQAGLAVDCRPWLVLTGRGRAAQPAVAQHYPDQCHIVPDLSTAVDSILEKVNGYKPNSNLHLLQ